MLMSDQYVTSCCLSVSPEGTFGPNNLASHSAASRCSRVPSPPSPYVPVAAAVITLRVSLREASSPSLL